MGCPQVTYTTLLDGYVKAGDLEGARLLWLDMRQSNVLPNAATFNTLLTGLAASPEPESMKVRFNGLLAVNVFHPLLAFCWRLFKKLHSRWSLCADCWARDQGTLTLSSLGCCLKIVTSHVTAHV